MRIFPPLLPLPDCIWLLEEFSAPAQPFPPTPDGFCLKACKTLDRTSLPGDEPRQTMLRRHIALRLPQHIHKQPSHFAGSLVNSYLDALRDSSTILSPNEGAP